MSTIEQMLRLIDEPHRSDCLTFISLHQHLFDTSKGSTVKHQAWPGGYRDHITEVMRIALVTYRALEEIRPLPFSLSDALLGCFIHDIEKVWVHAIEEKDRKVIDRAARDEILSAFFHLTPEHWNAAHYAHGEGGDYHPVNRVQGPLAAFVHHCDNTSARIWFDQPSTRPV